MLAISIGALPLLRLIATLLLVGTVPGSSLVRRVFSSPTFLHYLILGSIAGLALWSVGGMLSHITGLVLVRWIPILLGFTLWFVPRRKKRIEANPPAPPFPVHGVLGSTVGLLAMLPSLRTALSTQPLDWTGWYRFQADIPFHVAITSEVAARAAQEAPWVAGTGLNYTWLFHSAAGVWASIANIPSADILLQAWPALFVVLIPTAVSLAAWEITHERYVALGAPILYVLAHGLVFSPGYIQQVPLFQISPTRDFADLFILFAVLGLARLLWQAPQADSRVWWLVVVALSTFVATGAKGSAMPILVGGVLSAILLLVVMRRLRVRHLAVLAIFAVSAATSYFLVLPDPSLTDALKWGPLTFLSPDTSDRMVVSIVFLATMVFAVLGIWVVIGRSLRDGWVISSLLAGTLLAGLLGLGLLSHPGYSQLYFWQSAQPLLAIALAWCGVIMFRESGRAIGVAMLAVFFLSQVLWLTTNRVLVTGLMVLALSICAALWVSRSGGVGGAARPTSWFARSGTLLAGAALLTQCAQLVSIPMGTAGGAASSASDAGAIHDSQLAAFQFIRSASSPNDKLITNKHCLDGSVTGGDCDIRWFAATAWTERRVLVDGWGNTQHGPAPDWVQDKLDLSDDFISSPTLVEKSELISLGVRYVYVDKREPFAAELSSVAILAYSSEWANVYILN